MQIVTLRFENFMLPSLPQWLHEKVGLLNFQREFLSLLGHYLLSSKSSQRNHLFIFFKALQFRSISSQTSTMAFVLFAFIPTANVQKAPNTPNTPIVIQANNIAFQKASHLNTRVQALKTSFNISSVVLFAMPSVMFHNPFSQTTYVS